MCKSAVISHMHEGRLFLLQDIFPVLDASSDFQCISPPKKPQQTSRNTKNSWHLHIVTQNLSDIIAFTMSAFGSCYIPVVFHKEL